MSHGNDTLPNFVDVGQGDELLPEGIYQVSVDDVREVFVDYFPGSLSRGDIFRRWRRFSELIRGVVDVEHEYLDGSFVTTRPNPQDVDASYWISAAALDGLPMAKQQYLSRLFGQAGAYRCDAYLAPVCQSGHPAYGVFTHIRGWTERYWPSYKNPRGNVVDGVRKGYVEVVT